MDKESVPTTTFGQNSTDDNSSTITFGDNNSFSIRCGKCADIHNAQLDGKTNKSCECDCHNTYTQPYVPYYPPYCPPVYDPCCPVIPIYTTGTAVDLTGGARQL